MAQYLARLTHFIQARALHRLRHNLRRLPGVSELVERGHVIRRIVEAQGERPSLRRWRGDAELAEEEGGGPHKALYDLPRRSVSLEGGSEPEQE